MTNQILRELRKRPVRLPDGAFVDVCILRPDLPGATLDESLAAIANAPMIQVVMLAKNEAFEFEHFGKKYTRAALVLEESSVRAMVRLLSEALEPPKAQVRPGSDGGAAL